ncbi:hypothetical protein, partial [Deinococcus aquatilis]|uniref:hypothetical protein n=1 Tax=Deinococcus aquatilis TaxID=519440 RepID=UPI003CCBE5B5
SFPLFPHDALQCARPSLQKGQVLEVIPGALPMDLLETLLAHNKGTTKRLIEQSAPLTKVQLDEGFDLGLRTVWLTAGQAPDRAGRLSVSSAMSFGVVLRRKDEFLSMTLADARASALPCPISVNYFPERVDLH